MSNPFQYSSALNNIPKSKLDEQRATIISACDVCSKVDVRTGGGVCAKCNTHIKAINRYYQSNIPVSYWALSMEKNFTGYAPLLEKYNELVGDLPKMFRDGRSLLVSGFHGVGKTMMATALLKKAVLKGHSGSYTTLSDAVAALTGAEYQEQFAVRKQLQMVDMLVIDEFDSRFVSSNASNDLFARSLENIIRTRLANKLCTIVISNSPNVIETLSGALKSSLGSLFNLLEGIVVLGKDHREQ
jgi:DNA replication protein DnaC